MELESAVKKRRSVKKFSGKKPSWKKIMRAMDLARFAPMAGNQNATKFVLVDKRELIEKLADASQQSFVGDADYLVVVVTDDSKLERSYADKGETFARQQAGAMIQNFLLGLTKYGLATTWVGYFEESQVKRALEISGDLKVEAMFPIGIARKGEGGDKKKPELENMIYFNYWKNKKMVPEGRVSVSAA